MSAKGFRIQVGVVDRQRGEPCQYKLIVCSKAEMLQRPLMHYILPYTKQTQTPPVVQHTYSALKKKKIRTKNCIKKCSCQIANMKNF